MDGVICFIDFNKRVYQEYQPNPSEAVSIFAIVMASIFTVVGFFGNLFTIIALLRNSKIRGQAMTKFIISLAVSDLLFCCISTPSIGYGIYAKDFLSENNCSYFYFVVVGNYAVSVYNLVLITVHNYVAICYNSKYHKVNIQCKSSICTYSILIFKILKKLLL